MTTKPFSRDSFYTWIRQPTTTRGLTRGGSRSGHTALSALLLLSLAMSHTASAAPCMTRAEKSAFDMRSMQSQLMIVALKCGDTGYNLFMQQHQAELKDAYAWIGSYFARVNHTSGEDERDSFITELANAQEQAGLQRGPAFCSSMRTFVSDSLAMREADEVPALMARNGTNTNRSQLCPDEIMGTPSAPPPTRARLNALLDRIKAGH